VEWGGGELNHTCYPSADFCQSTCFDLDFLKKTAPAKRWGPGPLGSWEYRSPPIKRYNWLDWRGKTQTEQMSAALPLIATVITDHSGRRSRAKCCREHRSKSSTT
jgi:hypothetical protein